MSENQPEVKSESVEKCEAAQAGEHKEYREQQGQLAQAIVGIAAPGTEVAKEPIWKTIQAFQKDFPGVEKKRHNTFTESYYASLDDIWNAAFPHMDGKLWTLAWVDTIHAATGVLSLLQVCIYNADGDYVSSTLPIPNSMESPQKVGSALTYYRRYLICTMLGIIESSDDDGNAAEVGKNAELTVSSDQLKKINELIAATGTDAADVVAYIETSYRKAAIEHVSYGEAATIIKMLEHKQGKQRAAQ